MYTCKYCGKEFETKQQLGGHSTYCEKNPKKQVNLENLNKIRNSKKHIKSSIIYYCEFCGKPIHNKGCLVLHERTCIKNPNRIISKTAENKERRELNKELGIKRTLSNEHKQKIREGLQRWKETHYNEFLNYSKQKSKCSENFKQYLRQNNISFIEEYSPYKERLYSLDIAFPDEKIAIEINGSQHYDNFGNLNEYTLEKQRFFEERGWKIIQIFYKWCYNITNKNEKIQSILELPIHNKNYVKEIYKRTHIKLQEKTEKLQKKENEILERKTILFNMLYNSNIDFSKSGWNKKCVEYLEKNNYKFTKQIFRQIRTFFPDFLKDNNVWKRKGSKIIC